MFFINQVTLAVLVLAALSVGPTGSLCQGNPEAIAPKRVCNHVCPEIYQPVCGTDGKTYGNSCQLGIAACENPGKKISFDYMGQCKSSGKGSCR